MTTMTQTLSIPHLRDAGPTIQGIIDKSELQDVLTANDFFSAAAGAEAGLEAAGIRADRREGRRAAVRLPHDRTQRGLQVTLHRVGGAGGFWFLGGVDPSPPA